MDVVTTRQIGKEVCAALGLESKRVRSIVIEMHASDIVKINVSYTSTNPQIQDGLIPVLKRYKLVEIED